MKKDKIKIEYLQKKMKNCQDSFWYDGDIALLTMGDRVALVVAAGEIRIHSKAGELVHDGWKERNGGIKGGLHTDKDLRKIGQNYSDAYHWENNNWFECFFRLKSEDTWEDIMGDVCYTYNDAIQMGKDILRSKDYEHLWKR